MSANESTAVSDQPPNPSLTGKIRGLLQRGGAFLVVGAIGFVVDAGTYNLLVFLGGEGPLFHAPLVAKIISIGVATVVTYFGNKWWTYSDHEGDTGARHILIYAVLNVLAIGLQLGCLGFSRYVLGLDSPLADNVSGTLIGQAVAMGFRFWAYGKFVFTRTPENDR
ncbi:GtrA family protein [Nocardia sp. CDC160]|uniref:GtrA family protein n=1 Tax=Nocardia sp. CDC160 TaxID=3112166 RepID=UPI002DB662CA|nr:GtrA family protein [Nocardia sp. CDC160]MEC3913997.1 GtrA family protein [Nocardia sp. CDC160]